ncbi:hypothetical protein V2G26_005485 [Clonostachys chloroleuca]
MATPAFERQQILAWLHERKFHSATPLYLGQVSGRCLKKFSKKLDLMTHEVLYFDFVGDQIYQAAKIRYLVKGDNPEEDVIEIPGFAVFNVKHGEDEKLRCYKAEIFLDPSPVFHRIAEKSL